MPPVSWRRPKSDVGQTIGFGRLFRMGLQPAKGREKWGLNVGQVANLFVMSAGCTGIGLKVAGPTVGDRQNTSFPPNVNSHHKPRLPDFRECSHCLRHNNSDENKGPVQGRILCFRGCGRLPIGLVEVATLGQPGWHVIFRPGPNTTDHKRRWSVPQVAT
jgi:hypothetical protein